MSGNQRRIRALYIGLDGYSPTRRNLSDGDTAYLLELAAAADPPIPPTRLIEEIVSCWCAEKRREWVNQSVGPSVAFEPSMAGERDE